MNFEIDVLSDFDSIKESELSSVFDNLLDNAFEAAKASQEKYILLRITKFNNMNIVVIKNSCDKVPSNIGTVLILSKAKPSGITGGLGFVALISLIYGHIVIFNV